MPTEPAEEDKNTKSKADSYAIQFRASDIYFLSEKKIGLLMKSDTAKSGGVKSDLILR